MSLLSKLKNRMEVKDAKTTISKVVAGLVLSLSVVGMVACGTTAGGSSSGSGSGSSSGTGSGSGSGSGSQKTNNYSALLNGVLENSNYNELLDYVKRGVLSFDSAAFDPHPYTFFANKGYDVNNIKNGSLQAYTKAYTVASEPNNLYMLTYCADSSNTYFNEYVLRYSLTSQEMADYKMLHEQKYVQAVFMNDAISASKTAEVLSECRSSITAHKTINSEIANLGITRNMIGNYGTDILFKDFDETTQKFSVYIFPNVGFGTPDDMIEQQKLGIYYLICNFQEMKVNNNAFCGPTIYQDFLIDETLFDYTKPNDYTIDATWYTSQYASLYLSDNLNLK